MRIKTLVRLFLLIKLTKGKFKYGKDSKRKDCNTVIKRDCRQ